jgi:hypothetical protein
MAIIQQLQDELKDPELKPLALVTACANLTERLRAIELAAPANEDHEDHLRLKARVQELTAYLYLSATVTELFSGPQSADELRKLDAAGDVGLLVRARQDLRVHPGIAFARVNALRQKRNLDVLRRGLSGQKIAALPLDLG